MAATIGQRMFSATQQALGYSALSAGFPNDPELARLKRDSMKKARLVAAIYGVLKHQSQ